jgi:hypothetical protein
MRSGSGSARLDLYVGDSQKGPEVLAESTASERMHRSLSRGRTAVHWVTAVTEGKIDRPYPGLNIVSQRAGQRDPANDLCVRDHFVLGGTSCRLQE